MDNHALGQDHLFGAENMPVVLREGPHPHDAVQPASGLIAVALAKLAIARDVHDRYQSRVVWLAPFAALLLLARWRSNYRLIAVTVAA